MLPQEEGLDMTTGSSEMESPIPVGFTEESWEEYLLDLVYRGSTVRFGGTDVVYAVIDEPLAWDGPVPEVELVAMSAGELEELGVEPGDADPASTPLRTRIYLLAEEGAGGAGDAEAPSKEFPDTPEMNPDENFWDDKVGCSLAFGRDSGIALTGSFLAGWPPPVMFRRGDACFNGYYTQGEGCVVGWLSDDGSDVGPQYFDPARHFNRLLVVDGNIGSAPYPGTHGLGSTVTVSTRLVCRQKEDDFGYSIDLEDDDLYDFNQNGVIDDSEKCSIRLWDLVPNYLHRGAFFIDMERY